MLNGRLGTNDFTHISKPGRSVVDYVCVPHEQYASYSDFSVHKMTDISNTCTFNLYGYKMSDHSVLLWTQQPMKHMPDTEHFSESQENVNRSKKFVLNDIPASFLNCEESLQAITDTVNKIERKKDNGCIPKFYKSCTEGNGIKAKKETKGSRTK